MLSGEKRWKERDASKHTHWGETGASRLRWRRRGEEEASQEERWSRPLLSVRLWLPSLTPLHSCEHSGTHWASHIFSNLLHFSYIFLHFLLHINRLTCSLRTYHTLAIPHPPYLSTLLSLSPSLSLIRGHFYFKAPPLSAISEGN